jgi:hypothetical protein
MSQNIKIRVSGFKGPLGCPAPKAHNYEISEDWGLKESWQMSIVTKYF